MLRQPDAAVGRGHRGMDRGRAEMRHAVFLDRGRDRIEPRDAVRRAVIRHDEAAVLRRHRAPREAIAIGQLVLHVDDLHRLVGERADEVLVGRNVGGRGRQHRVLAEQHIDIGRDVVRVLVGERLRAVEEEMHRAAHVVDAIAPAVLVVPDRRHAALEAVAREAAPDENVLALQHLAAEHIGKQLCPLIGREVGPLHRAGLERDIVRDALRRGQRNAVARIGRVADGPHAELIRALRRGSRTGSGPGDPTARWS